MRVTILTLLVAVPFVLADKTEPDDPNASKARELKVTALRFEGRGGAKPTKITSAEELARAVPAKEAQDEIRKQVSFKKEYVLLFQWSGSGGDRLSFTTEKGKDGEVVVFQMKRGLTRDLRRHSKVYALPKKATYKYGS